MFFCQPGVNFRPRRPDGNGAIRSFLKDVWATSTAPLTVFLWLASSLILTISGPFGTYADQTYSMRGLYWLTTIGISIIVARSIELVFARLLPNMKPPLWAVGIAVGMTLIYTPILLGVTILAGVLSPPYLQRGLEGAGLVFVVSLSIAMAKVIFSIQQRPPVRLMERLPEVRRWEDVIRLSSRDHYVEVVTNSGSETLLMRFSDALVELEGIQGLRVHRSHWVACHAVVAQVREGGRLFLVMRDGARVPVSRGYVDAVRASGLLPKAA